MYISIIENSGLITPLICGYLLVSEYLRISQGRILSQHESGIDICDRENCSSDLWLSDNTRSVLCASIYTMIQPAEIYPSIVRWRILSQDESRIDICDRENSSCDLIETMEGLQAEMMAWLLSYLDIVQIILIVLSLEDHFGREFWARMNVK